MTRNLTLPTLFLLLSFLITPAAYAENKDERLDLAYSMANMTLTMITDQKKNHTQRIESLKRGFSNIVDTKWIARFVLGANWRKATPEQRERYSELYHDFLMDTYISTYASNDEQKITDIKVLGVKDEAEGQFTTRTEIRMSNAQTLKVDYRVHPIADNKYKIIDVIVEDVSLLSTHRSEFMQTASARGIGGVIKTLEKRLN